MATVTERESQRQLMNRKRAAARDIGAEVDAAYKLVNKRRRAALERDTPKWLRTIFPDEFAHEFTADQLEWIRETEERMEQGEDKAIAAPRGEGKTTITERVILKAVITGKIRYPVLVQATGVHARRSLRNIKKSVEKNQRLRAWYPEVCLPVFLMDRAPQRAKKQTYHGAFTDMAWEVDSVRFPTIPMSRCSGSMTSAHGLDAAIRGINEEGLRPDFVLIDDPETRESSVSEVQCETRENVIEKDLAGLGGPGKKCGRLMLCTKQNKTCISAKYTDPSQKPWDGKCYGLVKTWPKHEELWLEYVDLYQKDRPAAFEFYVAHRQAMDEGAVVSNPNRYISGLELSAIQHCYNLIARIGRDNFFTEYQNDPPEESGPQDAPIDPAMVMKRISGFDRRDVPTCDAFVAFIDIGKYGFHWSATAWRQGGIGFVVEYGVHEVYGMGTAVDDKDTIDRAILTGLRRWKDEWDGKMLCGAEPRKFDRVLIDSGTFTDAVYAFTKEAGHPFYASKGFGQGKFHPGVSNPRTGHVSQKNWYITRLPQGIKLVGLDADHWKKFCHERFMTETFDKALEYNAGSLSLFSPGNEKRCHHAFAHHICAEKWREEFIEGKGLKCGFHVSSPNNHWLDATAGCCAAADMCGIKIVGPAKAPRPRVSLSQWAKKAKGAA